MMTSMGTRGDSARLTEIGLDAYLSKPVKETGLKKCLATVFKGQDHGKKPGDGLVTRHSIADSEQRDTHILLVEDNPINRKVSTAILDRLGYQTESAINGLEALELLKKRSFDLLIMDCEMPGIDGYEATKKIRAWKESGNRDLQTKSSLPIIAMTAHALEGATRKMS